MADVCWLEQIESDVPDADDWLSSDELLRLYHMSVPKRRMDWRMGRWTAKHAVAAYLRLYQDRPSLATIEVRANPSGAPEVFLEQEPAGVAISLSHRAGVCVCAIAPSEVRLGCDLEVIEPRNNAFLTDYFTPHEQALVAHLPAHQRPELLALLWSGKESTLKALHIGLRADTRSVVVHPCADEDGAGRLEDEALAFRANRCDCWSPLRVGCLDGPCFQGWWQRSSLFLKTLVAEPPPTMPLALKLTGEASLGKKAREPRPA